MAEVKLSLLTGVQAYTTILLVCLTLVYYGFMFIIDMLLVLKCVWSRSGRTRGPFSLESYEAFPHNLAFCRPDAALGLFACCKSLDKMTAAFAARKATSGGRRGKEEDGGDGINMVMNPAMLARAQAGGGAGDLLSAELLESIVDAPSPVQVRRVVSLRCSTCLVTMLSLLCHSLCSRWHKSILLIIASRAFKFFYGCACSGQR
jgi:hypothetical protein